MASLASPIHVQKTPTKFLQKRMRSNRRLARPTRAFKDPAQYDTEVNTARGFKSPTSSKSKKIKPTTKTKVDPAQYDLEENLERHLPNW